MSQTSSPSANVPYGLARVCRVWGISRSGFYQRKQNRELEARGLRVLRKRGPRCHFDDETLVEHIRQAIEDSPWVGEGYRKVWARLRHRGVRTSSRRVLRLMRKEGLLAPTRAGRAHGPKAHDGTIITDRPDELWGTDATSALTDEGRATIFFVIDHCTAECLGIHAARIGTRWEALEPLRQAVRSSYGAFAEGVSRGLSLRHDHGSQFTSHDYQAELKFLGIQSSPSYVGEPQGNGCAERFVRTLKEQLLWLKRFKTVEELRQALGAFAKAYNEGWLIQRHGHRTPAARRAAWRQSQEAAA